MWDKLIALLKEAFSYFVAYKAGQNSAKIQSKDKEIKDLKIKNETIRKLKDVEYRKKLHNRYKRK